MRQTGLAVFLTLLAAGCATPQNAESSRPRTPAAGSQTMKYGDGDGSSCAEAVIVHERNEIAGGRAEYAWMAAKYPGYRRGMQSLIRCNDKPADRIRIRTADGQELDVFFDISEYFGRL